MGSDVRNAASGFLTMRGNEPRGFAFRQVVWTFSILLYPIRRQAVMGQTAHFECNRLPVLNEKSVAEATHFSLIAFR